ncbi:hypothetical protein Syun_029924 [Stephania yunnanensis]|uniref:Uncharacterized protein n=1 Tax=Stephania yunnanensis TaxID=152371 RepID=A0AAP0E8V6_9MAGN
MERGEPPRRRRRRDDVDGGCGRVRRDVVAVDQPEASTVRAAPARTIGRGEPTARHPVAMTDQCDMNELTSGGADGWTTVLLQHRLRRERMTPVRRSGGGNDNGVKQRHSGALPDRSIPDETQQQWTTMHDFGEALLHNGLLAKKTRGVGHVSRPEPGFAGLLP